MAGVCGLHSTSVLHLLYGEPDNHRVRLCRAIDGLQSGVALVSLDNWTTGMQARHIRTWLCVITWLLPNLVVCLGTVWDRTRCNPLAITRPHHTNTNTTKVRSLGIGRDRPLVNLQLNSVTMTAFIALRHPL